MQGKKSIYNNNNNIDNNNNINIDNNNNNIGNGNVAIWSYCLKPQKHQTAADGYI